ncbi:MAG: hypothetical protein U1C74_04355 [Phenylobacterium sp.]|nr:hypothetical protein [Phenylobacterium sp.]
MLHSSDVRRALAGVALAAAAGLMMGTALKPNLDAEAVEGPQQLIAGGGPREYAAAADHGVAVYRGALPTYVVGTDSLRPPEELALIDDGSSEYPADTDVEAEAADDYAADVMVYEAPVIARARWADEPRPEPRYPSQQGGGWHESDLPPAPEGPDGDYAPL